MLHSNNPVSLSVDVQTALAERRVKMQMREMTLTPQLAPESAVIVIEDEDESQSAWFECPVCFENPFEFKTILGCGHNICLKCDINIKATQNQYQLNTILQKKFVKCPICRGIEKPSYEDLEREVQLLKVVNERALPDILGNISIARLSNMWMQARAQARAQAVEAQARAQAVEAQARAQAVEVQVQRPPVRVRSRCTGNQGCTRITYRKCVSCHNRHCCRECNRCNSCNHYSLLNFRFRPCILTMYFDYVTLIFFSFMKRPESGKI